MKQEAENKNLLDLYEDQDLAGDNVQRANGGCACVSALCCCDFFAQDPEACNQCCDCGAWGNFCSNGCCG